MQDSQFITFQKFNDEGPALELCALLKEHQIDHQFENSSASFDPAFANSEIDREYRIKLRKDDFAKADNLLLAISSKQLDEVGKDYFLFDFSDKELLEVVAKKDEWSSLDFLLAQKILKERGKEIQPEDFEALKKQRLNELSKPEESQKVLVFAGYIMALLGGLLGVLIGWQLMTHTKTLPNGERVYGYSRDDRMHGKRIVIIGIVFFLLWISFKILL
jgi:hypothetical protein